MRPVTGLLLVAFLAVGCEKNAENPCSNGCPATRIWQYGSPALFAAMIDGNDWSELQPSTTEGEYLLCACDEFDVASVCADSDGGVMAQRWRGTSADAETIYFSACEGGPASPPADATVRGTIAQPSWAWFAGLGQSLLPGRFALSGYQGTYDFAVTDDYATNASRLGKALIRRNVRIGTETDLGLLDLETEGFELLPRAIDIIGLAADDTITTETRLSTKHGGRWAMATTRGPMVHEVPATALVSSDTQEFSIAARSDSYARGYYSADLSAVELLPRLDPASLSSTGYSWTDLPTQEFDEMTFLSSAERYVSNRITASKTWLDRHAARALVLDWTIPGFRAEWAVNVPKFRTISILDIDDETYRSSAVTQ